MTTIVEKRFQLVYVVLLDVPVVRDIVINTSQLILFSIGGKCVTY